VPSATTVRKENIQPDLQRLKLRSSETKTGRQTKNAKIGKWQRLLSNKKPTYAKQWQAGQACLMIFPAPCEDGATARHLNMPGSGGGWIVKSLVIKDRLRV